MLAVSTMLCQTAWCCRLPRRIVEYLVIGHSVVPGRVLVVVVVIGRVVVVVELGGHEKVGTGMLVCGDPEQTDPQKVYFVLQAVKTLCEQLLCCLMRYAVLYVA